MLTKTTKIMQFKAYCKARSTKGELLMTVAGRDERTRAMIGNSFFKGLYHIAASHFGRQALIPSQTWLVMKLTIFLLTVAFLNVHARSFSQEVIFRKRCAAAKSV